MAIYRFSKAEQTVVDWSNSGLAMPEEGLIFHAPLSDDTGMSIDGGDPQFVTEDGIPCVYFSDSSLYVDIENMPQGSAARSFSFFCKPDSVEDLCFVDIGSDTYNKLYEIGCDPDGKFCVWCYDNDNMYDTTLTTGEFYHVAVTLDAEGTEKLYINGNLMETKTRSSLTNTNGTNMRLGSARGWGAYYGYMAAFRIYNKALTDAEISTLSQEFKRVIHYTTSYGFDDFGHPIAYDSASAAGLLTIKLPEDGLVFYSALTSAEGFDNALGNPQFVEKDGIPCVHFDGESLLNVYLDGMPQGSSARTISFHFMYDDFFEDCAMVATGNPSTDEQYNIGIDGNRKICVWGYDNDTHYSFATDYNEFYHCAITLENDGTEKLYINGELMQTKDHSGLNTTGTELCVGSEFGLNYFIGYMAALRVYNRALSADEVQQLAKEFPA